MIDVIKFSLLNLLPYCSHLLAQWYNLNIYFRIFLYKGETVKPSQNPFKMHWQWFSINVELQWITAVQG